MVKRKIVRRATIKRRPKVSRQKIFVPKEVYHDSDYEGAGTKWELYRVAPGNHFVGIVWGGRDIGDEYACFGPFDEPLGRAVTSLGDEIDGGYFRTIENKNLRDNSERIKLVVEFYKNKAK